MTLHPEAGRPATSPSVSVILVSWNAREVVESCLASLTTAGGATSPFQVILVDNASRDGTADFVDRHFPDVHVVREPTNRGFAGGVNRGLQHARAPLVLLLNCDTVAHVGSVAVLAETLDRAPGEVVAVGGCLLDERGSPQHGFHVRRFPTLATWVVDLLLIDAVWPANPVTRRYLALDQTTTATGPVEVDQPAAACLMVRRAALDRIGGLDERFFPAWFEDVDLCLRLRRAGGRILFVPGARFTHRGGEAMRALGLGGFSRAWYRNLRRYVRKHQGRGAAIVCRSLIVAGMTLRVLISLGRLRPRDAAAYARVALDALTPGDAAADANT